MKYYELKPIDAKRIGYYKKTKQHHINGTAGRLKNGNFALSTKALYNLKIINEVNFLNKIPKEIPEDKWIVESSNI